MKNLISRLLLLLFVAACGTRAEDGHHTAAVPPPATPPSPPSVVTKFRGEVSGLVDSLFGRGHFNGSVLVAKDGEVIYEKYYGFTNPRQHTDSITAHTPIHLASVSKTLTAAAILKLCGEGKLDIHDSLSKYLPGFPSAGVTIKTLLNHRSGLPNYVHYMDRLGWDRSRFVTNQDVLDFLISRHKDIDIGPADRHFSYSNTNYALLALVIEKVSGLSYPEYMKKAIFEPLGMSDSYVFTPEDSARSVASYYYSGRPYAFDFLDYVYGDKNIYSTARDLLKFNEALAGSQFIRPDLLDSAYAPYSFEKPGIHNYGLGWRMYVLKNGKKLIYHNGWWHGNRTAFYRLIDEHAVIIALCNNDCKTAYSSKILADVFGNYLQRKNDSRDDDNENLVVTSNSVPLPAKLLRTHARQKKSGHSHALTAKK